MKLIHMISGPAKGRFLLLDEKRNRIIHPNGFVSEKCVLPWNGEWRESTRPMPQWASQFLEASQAASALGSRRTEKKADAARRNGALGGRPRKEKRA